jgi:hypothetical protein
MELGILLNVGKTSELGPGGGELSPKSPLFTPLWRMFYQLETSSTHVLYKYWYNGLFYLILINK